MTVRLIRKRNNNLVPFDRSRIEVAMRGAYTDVGVVISYLELSAMCDGIISEIKDSFVGRVATVEDIQDLVEKSIINKGDLEVARAFMAYRMEHAMLREERKKDLLRRIEKGDINIKKRDGSLVRFDMSQIREAVANFCRGHEKVCDIDEIIEAAKLNIFDGISTSEINKAVTMAMKSRIERDPAFSFISARFLINDLYKDVIGINEYHPDFKQTHKEFFEKKIRQGVEVGRVDARMLDFDFEKLSSALVPERDTLFNYLGAQTLYERYFLRDSNQKHLETPQYFWMRIAMGLSLLEENKTETAIEFYNTISQMLYVPSTPTLFHSGTSHPQMSSCYLSTVEDNLAHIFKVVGDNAQLAKYSGGVGNDWTNIRATNSLVKTINTGSQGVIPFLKVVDATTASINRSGNRRGATAVYLETWHYDIEEFLDLRKNTGDDRRRTHDLNTVNWIPDLFMKRVEEDGEWTLFSPNEVSDLHHIYGKRFESRYAEYEQMAREGKIALYKTIKAKDLWRKMVTMIFETSHPWFTFKDPSNIRSPQDHMGVVHNSNLCTEITLNTSAEETAVCNLGSINMVRHFEGTAINKELMAKTIKTAMRMLDNVIDINFYPTKEAETSNLRHRPVGLGIMALQDVLYRMDLPFDSVEAVNFSDEMMEFISYNAILGSSLLAKEKGTYSSYKGSKWDRNLFPIDTLSMMEEERGIQTGIDKGSSLDWTPVRESVKKYGMRNSNTMAIAPTAHIANISGCLPSIEPIYKNLYVKSNFSGEFTVVNSFLVADLKEVNLWNKNILDKIKYYDGSIQNISEIPEHIRAKYKEVFEISPDWVIRHAAYRGKWIDQSQSINLFTKSDSGKFIGDMYMNAWRSGLKTTYYLRTLAASSTEKATIDINQAFKDIPAPAESIVITDTEKPKVYVFTDESCESCQ